MHHQSQARTIELAVGDQATWVVRLLVLRRDRLAISAVQVGSGRKPSAVCLIDTAILTLIGSLL